MLLLKDGQKLDKTCKKTPCPLIRARRNICLCFQLSNEYLFSSKSNHKDAFRYRVSMGDGRDRRNVPDRHLDRYACALAGMAFDIHRSTDHVLDPETYISDPDCSLAHRLCPVKTCPVIRNDDRDSVCIARGVNRYRSMLLHLVKSVMDRIFHKWLEHQRREQKIRCLQLFFKTDILIIMDLFQCYVITQMSHLLLKRDQLVILEHVHIAAQIAHKTLYGIICL